ncbi:MAG TPA: hypothetical protein PL019_05615 [Caldisericia bacterium]|nr:hypothetical protein [Caldisericia bacterium]
MKVPNSGDKIRVKDTAPTGVAGKTFTVMRVEKSCMDVWESCAYGNEDNGKFIYIVVTTTGERLELEWVEIV